MLVVIKYVFLTHSQRRIAASGVGVDTTENKLDSSPINSTPWQQCLTARNEQPGSYIKQILDTLFNIPHLKQRIIHVTN